MKDKEEMLKKRGVGEMEVGWNIPYRRTKGKDYRAHLLETVQHRDSVMLSWIC